MISLKDNKIQRLFKEQYNCELLTSNTLNKDIINGFCGGKFGRGLEDFLKTNAWDACNNGTSKVYIIKKKGDNQINAYFSLKCGMLYSPYTYEQLEGEKKDFFDLILEAVRHNDKDLLATYKNAGFVTDEQFINLYEEARVIVNQENEKRKPQTRNIYDVVNTYPAIEIENLCKNYNIHAENKDVIPFGFLIFWTFIVPIILNISSKVGCQYVYIYAADQGTPMTENKKDIDNDPRPLMRYYKSDFGFHDAGNLFFVRPQYDFECYEMIQSIDELRSNATDTGSVMRILREIQAVSQP